MNTQERDKIRELTIAISGVIGGLNSIINKINSLYEYNDCGVINNYDGKLFWDDLKMGLAEKIIRLLGLNTDNEGFYYDLLGAKREIMFVQTDISLEVEEMMMYGNTLENKEKEVYDGVLLDLANINSKLNEVLK